LVQKLQCEVREVAVFLSYSQSESLRNQ